MSKHTYQVMGSRILSEAWGNHLYLYLYDASGSPIGLQYRSRTMAEGLFYTFWFEKNLQGDIIAIYNESGVKVLSYTYDAWGSRTVQWHDQSSTNQKATYNPFGYRGYFYDRDLKLYYLGSRYYDPAIGRFINADGQLNEGILGNNLYAYCGNNPVMYADPDGCFAISLALLGGIVGTLIGAVSGGVVAYNIAKNNGATGGELFGWTMLGILGGGVVGGALGAGVGAIVTKATGILGFSMIKGNFFVITQTIVLGHYGYAELAQSLGYSYYEIPTALYNSLSNAERWAINSQFLYDCYKLGANFIVEATREIGSFVYSRGSWLYYEIAYLIQLGYQWLEDLSALIRG